MATHLDIDALLAQLCVRHDLRLLTANRDLEGIARFTPLQPAGPQE